MTALKPGEIVHQKIMENAGTAEGFRPCMAGAYSKNAAIICRKMAVDGTLRAVKVSHVETRYFFSSQQAREALKTYAIEKAKLFSAMPESEKRPPKMAGSHARKPKPGIKSAPAEYRAGYKFSSSSMPDRFAVSVPFLQIGTAAWKMEVGLAA